MQLVNISIDLLVHIDDCHPLKSPYAKACCFYKIVEVTLKDNKAEELHSLGSGICKDVILMHWFLGGITMMTNTPKDKAER